MLMLNTHTTACAFAYPCTTETRCVITTTPDGSEFLSRNIQPVCSGVLSLMEMKPACLLLSYTSPIDGIQGPFSVILGQPGHKGKCKSTWQPKHSQCVLCWWPGSWGRWIPPLNSWKRAGYLSQSFLLPGGCSRGLQTLNFPYKVTSEPNSRPKIKVRWFTNIILR